MISFNQWMELDFKSKHQLSLTVKLLMLQFSSHEDSKVHEIIPSRKERLAIFA